MTVFCRMGAREAGTFVPDHRQKGVGDEAPCFLYLCNLPQDGLDYIPASALNVARRHGMSLWHTAFGSIAMGGGIGAMHYIGMHALRMRARCHFDPTVVALSVILAVGISFVTLRLVFLARNHKETTLLRKVASASLIGV